VLFLYPYTHKYINTHCELSSPFVIKFAFFLSSSSGRVQNKKRLFLFSNKLCCKTSLFSVTLSFNFIAVYYSKVQFLFLFFIFLIYFFGFEFLIYLSVEQKKIKKLVVEDSELCELHNQSVKLFHLNRL
jgi:hypothetical protein